MKSKALSCLFPALLLLPAVLVGGCSHDSIEADDTRLGRQLAAADRVYIHLVLSAVSSSPFYSTRACEAAAPACTRANGDYDDGSALEYALHSATLILFSRNTTLTPAESGARFLYAVDLQPQGSATAPGGSRVTQQHDYIAQVHASDLALPAGHNRLEAFVVANASGLVVPWADGRLFVSGTTYGPGDLSFGTLATMAFSHIGTPDAAGMLMTSAPVATLPGGSSSPAGCSVTTLAQVDASQLYLTAAEAASHPAVEVFLERAAAKVQLTQSVATAVTDEGLTYDPTQLRWAVDNENSTYYLARQVPASCLVLYNTAGLHRFVDDEPLLAAGSAYRIYWASDPNYGGSTAGITRRYATGSRPALGSAPGDVVYTTENTMDAANMLQDRSTGLVLSVPFHGGTDFYTLSSTGTGVIYDEALLLTKLQELALKTPLLTAWRAAHPSDALTIGVTLYDDGTTKRNDGSDVPAGQVTFRLALTGTDLTTADATTVAKTIEAANDITLYRGGRAYYRVMIKHFGDHETPLTKDYATASSYADLYGSPASEAAFLGRFGVLRDTWYLIDVEGVKRLGSAVVPSFGNVPDDDVEYLTLKIVILPWMMHEQQLHF